MTGNNKLVVKLRNERMSKGKGADDSGFKKPESAVEAG